MSNDIDKPHANIPTTADAKSKSVQGTAFSAKVADRLNNMREGAQNWKANADHRMKICNTCPNYEAPRCTLCGCFMIAKTKIPQARCPAGKW
jgi:hypothetical protein